jgi:hypothetical protein
MHSISIAIPTEAADRLRDLARRERRSPRQQAAVVVLAAFDREGTGSEPDDELPPKATPVDATAIRPTETSEIKA